jgi:ribosomal-protein-alanine N-acetyltransferase
MRRRRAVAPGDLLYSLDLMGVVRIEPMNEVDIADVLAIEAGAAMTEAQLHEELARTWARLWVAREGGGRVSAFLVSWLVADEIHILNVATLPERRRHGLARALLEHVIALGRAERCRHALLEVRRSNRGAIALYRAVGFFAMGLRTKYYPDDEDAVEMVLLFDPTTGDVQPHADEVRLES